MKNRTIIILCLVLVFMVSLFSFVTAMDKGITKPLWNRVLFYDNFNGNYTDKWTPINGNWYVSEGKYVQDVIEGQGGHWKYTKANFTGRNYNFEANVTALTDVALGGCSMSGYTPETWDPYGTQISIALFPRTQQISLYIMENGTTNEYIYYTQIELGQEYDLKAVVENKQVDVFLNEHEIISDKPTNLNSGHFYLISDDTHCLFDNVKITSNVKLTPEQTIAW